MYQPCSSSSGAQRWRPGRSATAAETNRRSRGSVRTGSRGEGTAPHPGVHELEQEGLQPVHQSEREVRSRRHRKYLEGGESPNPLVLFPTFENTLLRCVLGGERRWQSDPCGGSWPLNTLFSNVREHHLISIFVKPHLRSAPCWLYGWLMQWLHNAPFSSWWTGFDSRPGSQRRLEKRCFRFFQPRACHWHIGGRKAPRAALPLTRRQRKNHLTPTASLVEQFSITSVFLLTAGWRQEPGRSDRVLSRVLGALQRIARHRTDHGADRARRSSHPAKDQHQESSRCEGELETTRAMT